MKTMNSLPKLVRGDIYRSMDIAASGMSAQRTRMDAISANIANAETTNVDGKGGPYLRQHVQMNPAPKQTFKSVLREQVLKMKRTVSAHMLPTRNSKRTESTPEVEGNEVQLPNMKKNVIYDPTHPDADKNGFVVYPDVNELEEMVDLMDAGRSFEANVTVVNAAKSMLLKSLEI
jgi:flagellar basal-body rod protein FlgC